MSDMSDGDREEFLHDKIQWAFDRARKRGEFAPGDKVETLIALAEICDLQQSRSGTITEAVVSGRLCQACPCHTVAALGDERCPVRPESEEVT